MIDEAGGTILNVKSDSDRGELGARSAQRFLGDELLLEGLSTGEVSTGGVSTGGVSAEDLSAEDLSDRARNPTGASHLSKSPKDHASPSSSAERSTGPPHLSASAIAPGKLIFFGEHFVLYDAPAIAMGVSRYARATVEALTPGQDGVRFILYGGSVDHTITHSAMYSHSQRLQQRYGACVRGELRIDEILLNPEDLYIYAFVHFMDKMKLPLGSWQVSIDSQIPVGCGMGSSAATVAALYKALDMLYELHLPKSQLVELVKETETFVHGRSSGIDPALCVYAGIHTFCRGKLQSLSIKLTGMNSQKESASAPQACASLAEEERVEAAQRTPVHRRSCPVRLGQEEAISQGRGERCEVEFAYEDDLFQGVGRVKQNYWYWVDTGRPQSTTGECVSFVARFRNAASCRDEMEQLFHEIVSALKEGSSQRLIELLRRSHRSLLKLGVVPRAVEHFITAVEACGGCAKISGAGSIRGFRGGIVIAYGPLEILTLVKRFGYRAYGLDGDFHGIRAFS